MQNISQKEFDAIKKIKGLVRGQAPKNVAEFVLKKEGKNSLEKLEKTMSQMGYPVEYKKINYLGFYPLPLLLLTYFLAYKLFDYDRKTLQEIGTFQANSSFIISLFTRYFFSLGSAVKSTPMMWRKYFSLGDLKVVELNEKEKRARLILENFDTHKLHCWDLEGYFATVVNLLVDGKPICKEIKCSLDGDKYHEFLITW